jgi:hypothetical protein
LKVSLGATTDSVFMQSEWFTDIQPGEVLTFAANVTTDVASDGVVPQLVMFMGNFHMPSNYQGLLIQEGASGGTTQLPVDNNWRTIKATFLADRVGSKVADGESTVNFYEKGYQCAIAVVGTTGMSACNVYIDDVRVYRDETDIEKAFGPTAIEVAKDDTTLFDGTCESGADLAGLGWIEAVSGGTAAINQEPVNNMFTHAGTKSIEMYFPDADGTNKTEYVMATVRLNSEGAGGVDNRGSGLYTMTAWFKTNAPDVKSAPGVMFGMADNKFKNAAFADVGYAGAPLATGSWKKIVLPSVILDAGRLSLFAIARAEAIWHDGAPVKPAYWGSYGVVGENPGYEADAKVFVDDVQVHKIMDDATYFARSVFPAGS